jgi:hypothetical protein
MFGAQTSRFGRWSRESVVRAACGFVGFSLFIAVAVVVFRLSDRAMLIECFFFFFRLLLSCLFDYLFA